MAVGLVGAGDEHDAAPGRVDDRRRERHAHAGPGTARRARRGARTRDRVAGRPRRGVPVGTDAEVDDVEAVGQVGGVLGDRGLEVDGGDRHQVVRARHGVELAGVAVGVAVGRDALVDLPDADVRPTAGPSTTSASSIGGAVDPPDTASVARPRLRTAAPRRRAMERAARRAGSSSTRTDSTVTGGSCPIDGGAHAERGSTVAIEGYTTAMTSTTEWPRAAETWPDRGVIRWREPGSPHAACCTSSWACWPSSSPRGRAPSDQVNQTGAIETVAEQPFGKVLLVALTLGLVALACGG